MSSTTDPAAPGSCGDPHPGAGDVDLEALDAARSALAAAASRLRGFAADLTTGPPAATCCPAPGADASRLAARLHGRAARLLLAEAAVDAFVEPGRRRARTGSTGSPSRRPTPAAARLDAVRAAGDHQRVGGALAGLRRTHRRVEARRRALHERLEAGAHHLGAALAATAPDG
ncbi:hypothetical protein GCM10025868_28570 [Angustibacter aerolatus]|uniref:Uncharacterized protein n=1 Tax=Angustibacter aerolatus TaxID=1162965 RepID=A0ABQ6JIN3_9ACTN|nr:hypothetical protein [Angustibacter aerolatus]GMA87607.1 hypothetical protein GCM10025868_28570 [Angustibacter aerolatus]